MTQQCDNFGGNIYIYIYCSKTLSLTELYSNSCSLGFSLKSLPYVWCLYSGFSGSIFCTQSANTVTQGLLPRQQPPHHGNLCWWLTKRAFSRCYDTEVGLAISREAAPQGGGGGWWGHLCCSSITLCSLTKQVGHTHSLSGLGN